MYFHIFLPHAKKNKIWKSQHWRNFSFSVHGGYLNLTEKFRFIKFPKIYQDHGHKTHIFAFWDGLELILKCCKSETGQNMIHI